MPRLSSSSSFRFRPGSSAATTASSTCVPNDNLPGKAHGLLLLPPPPQPPSASSLAFAYKPALRAVLPQIRGHGPDAALDIALPLSQPIVDYPKLGESTRAEQFSAVAALVNGIYELAKTTCIEHGIPDCGVNAVDVRVLLVRYDPDAKPTLGLDSPQVEGHFDVITDLASLVRSHRHWTQLFVPNTEPAAQMFKQFRAIATASLGSSISRAQILCTRPVVVPGGLVINRPSTSGGRQQHEDLEPDRPYHRIVAIGNFNKLDGTTKALLTMSAFLLGEEDERSASSSKASSPVSSPSDSLRPFAAWDDNKSLADSTKSRPRSPRPRRAKHVRQLVLRADSSLPSSNSSSPIASTFASSKFLRQRNRNRIGGRKPTTKESTTRAGAEFWYDRVISFLEAIGNCDHTTEPESLLASDDTSSPPPLRAAERTRPPLGLVHAKQDGSHHLESFARTNSIVTKNGRRRAVTFEVVDEVSSGAIGTGEEREIGLEGEGVVRFGTSYNKKSSGRARSDSAVSGLVKGFTNLLGGRAKEEKQRLGDGGLEILLARS